MEETSSTKQSGNAKLIKLIKGSVPQIVGTVAGAIIGISYYTLVGCPNGTCGIVSSPYWSTIVGGFLGYAIGNIFSMRNEK